MGSFFDGKFNIIRYTIERKFLFKLSEQTARGISSMRIPQMEPFLYLVLGEYTVSDSKNHRLGSIIMHTLLYLGR